MRSWPCGLLRVWQIPDFAPSDPSLCGVPVEHHFQILYGQLSTSTESSPAIATEQGRFCDLSNSGGESETAFFRLCLGLHYHYRYPAYRRSNPGRLPHFLDYPGYSALGEERVRTCAVRAREIRKCRITPGHSKKPCVGAVRPTHANSTNKP